MDLLCNRFILICSHALSEYVRQLRTGKVIAGMYMCHLKLAEYRLGALHIVCPGRGIRADEYAVVHYCAITLEILWSKEVEDLQMKFNIAGHARSRRYSLRLSFCRFVQTAVSFACCVLARHLEHA
jgi:hypothetical protein